MVTSHRKPERERGTARTSPSYLSPSPETPSDGVVRAPGGNLSCHSRPVSMEIVELRRWTARCRWCCFGGSSRCHGMSASDTVSVLLVELLTHYIICCGRSITKIHSPHFMCQTCRSCGHGCSFDPWKIH